MGTNYLRDEGYGGKRHLNTFRDSILSIDHCIDNYMLGILRYCEMYDVATLIAPRPFLIESGSRYSIPNKDGNVCL